MATFSGVVFSTTSAIAAEQVVLKYRIFRESISVEELTTFAETGELSKSLRINFALARQDPRVVRLYLTEPAKVDPVFLDRVLNSRIGNVVLDEIVQHRAQWVTPPPEGIRVPETEARQYRDFQGYNNSPKVKKVVKQETIEV